MSADRKVGQRRSSIAASFSITLKRLSSSKARFVRKGQAAKKARPKPSIELQFGLKARRKFGINDWIDTDLAVR